jgi:hypothetical protein
MPEDPTRLPPPPFWRTRYFALVVMAKPERRDIDPTDIRQALERPIKQTYQADGRVRHWIWVPSRARYLRVVTLADGETVHNAFYDRDFKP